MELQLRFRLSNMDTTESEEQQEMSRLDRDVEQDKTDDVVVEDPSESGQGRTLIQLGILEVKYLPIPQFKCSECLKSQIY